MEKNFPPVFCILGAAADWDGQQLLLSLSFTAFMNPDVRWKQRFQHFDRALMLLREALQNGVKPLSMLEREGTIQRFEYSFELAWKTAKDYLEEQGIQLTPLSPREVVKQSFAAGIIKDGKTWIDMLNHRNALSHTYERETFDAAVAAIYDRYLPALNDLHQFLSRHLSDEDAASFSR